MARWDNKEIGVGRGDIKKAVKKVDYEIESKSEIFAISEVIKKINRAGRGCIKKNHQIEVVLFVNEERFL